MSRAGARRFAPLPVAALVGLSLVASACSGYTGSTAHRVDQWVQAVDLSSTDGLVLSDLAGIANGRRLGEFRATTTECAGLADDAGTAETNLPTPDQTLTTDLTSAYTDYTQAGSDCSTAPSFSSAAFRHYDVEVAAGNRALGAATQRLAPLASSNLRRDVPRPELVGPFPPGADPDAYDRLRRRVLWMFPSGIYLLGTRHGELRNLMTCNLVSQVATAPKLVAVSVEATAFSKELLVAGKVMTISLLDRADRPLVRKFAKPAEHDPVARTLNGVVYRDAPVSGAPIPEIARAYVDLRLAHQMELGSHDLFIGEVVDAGTAHDVGEDVAVLRMEDTAMNYGG